MGALTRLAAYAAGLTVAFVAAYALAGAVVPQGVVDDWARRAQPEGHAMTGSPSPEASPHGER